MKSLLQGGSATKNLPGKPPKKSGGPGLLGGALTALSTGLEAAEGNYAEAILGALSLTPTGRIARLAGLIFNAEQLLDLIGHGHIDEKDKPEGEKEPQEPSKSANGDSSPEIQGQGSDDETGVEPNTSDGNIPDAGEGENNNKGSSDPIKSFTDSAQPILDSTKDLFDKIIFGDQPSGDQSSAQPQTPVVPTSTTSSSSPASPPATGRQALMDQQRERRSSDDSTNIAQNTNTEAQDPIMPVHMGDTATEDLKVGQTNNELERLAEEERNINADPIISANPESKKATQQPVQKLPDPKPTIITNNSQTSSPSPINVDSDKSMTKVPMIASSNPENFYSLYSLHAYNVVV